MASHSKPQTYVMGHILGVSSLELLAIVCTLHTSGTWSHKHLTFNRHLRLHVMNWSNPFWRLLFALAKKIGRTNVDKTVSGPSEASYTLTLTLSLNTNSKPISNPNLLSCFLCFCNTSCLYLWLTNIMMTSSLLTNHIKSYIKARSKIEINMVFKIK